MQIEFRTKDESIRAQIEAFLQDWPSMEFFTVKTSGSTGKPKTLKIDRKYAEASARKTIDYLNLQKGNTALLCLSPETIAGKMMLIRSFVGELNLIVGDVSSSPLMSIQDNEVIDFAAMVPLQVRKSLESEKFKIQRIQNLIIGGAPITNALENEILAAKLHAFQTFGMTETISHIALRKIDGSAPVFKGVSNTTFSQGIEKNLIIHSPDIGVDSLETNDIVELIDLQSFRWIGRKDHVINTGGVKVFPEQIESKIRTDQNIFISSIADEILGQQVILCVEGNSFSKELLEGLSRYERPKCIYYFDKFNYTASDKVNRKETINRISNARKQVL
ncbi:MAG: AMP-binding protein [Crocinitomicaceae bacterium]